MSARWLAWSFILALVASLVPVGEGVPRALAAPEDPGQGEIYFPWVPRDATLGGIEGINGAITVQNLEIFPITLQVLDAARHPLLTTRLNPRASQTWTAAQLGIDAPGAAVVATAEWDDPSALARAGVCRAGVVSAMRSSAPSTIDQVTISEPPEQLGAVRVTQQGFTFPDDSYRWQYRDGRLFIDWSPAGPEPVAGSTYRITYRAECPPPRIAGLEKHATPTDGAGTRDVTRAVDGYSAVPIADLALASLGGAPLEGQSRWVLPIAQTNTGWNSVVVISNISSAPTTVSATFYPAGGQGVAGPSTMLLSGRVLAPGASVLVDLRDDAQFPEGEVGSVWIDATHGVVAAVFRVKPSTDMLLTNVAQPRTDDTMASPTVKYGPLVFRDYNGWNTGINIANLSSSPNSVTVTYYNYEGNVVAVEQRTIPPRAMEYIYQTATGNHGVGDEQITSAKLVGTAPLVVAIDEVKYLDGNSQWHAMSYPAQRAQAAGRAVSSDGTPINGRRLYESMLALPLVQKGNPLTGLGDTSGINLFNPDPAPVQAAVQFLSPTGLPVAPTVDATDAERPFTIELGAYAGATIYSLAFHELPNGLVGSAVIGAVCEAAGCGDGAGSLVGVSNNVNYQVAGDGSAVFNLAVVEQASFRFATQFTVEPLEAAVPVTDAGGEPGEQTVSAVVFDQFGDPLAGVPVTFSIASGPHAGLVDAQRTRTDASGTATFTYHYQADPDAAEPGADAIEVWVDLNRNWVRDDGELVTVQRAWIPDSAAP